MTSNHLEEEYTCVQLYVCVESEEMTTSKAQWSAKERSLHVSIQYIPAYMVNNGCGLMSISTSPLLGTYM